VADPQDCQPHDANVNPRVLAKIADAESKLDRVELQMEGMANSLSSCIAKTRVDQKAQTAKAQQKEELARSLKDIEATYLKNKLRLERDLNKMEQ
jgi:hypothetical protein